MHPSYLAQAQLHKRKSQGRGPSDYRGERAEMGAGHNPFLLARKESANGEDNLSYTTPTWNNVQGRQSMHEQMSMLNREIGLPHEVGLEQHRSTGPGKQQEASALQITSQALSVGPAQGKDTT